MKKSALIFLLLASLHARADLVIVQNVESGGNAHDVTIKIKGDKFRTDIADQLSSITDLNNGDTITLVHARKAYMKTTGDQMRDLIEKKMKAAMDDGGAPSAVAPVTPKIVDTGKSEKVGDFNAEIYTSQTKLMKFTYWISKDYTNYAVVNAQMQQFKGRQHALSDKMTSRNYLVPDTTKLDGLVLKTVMEDSKGVTSQMTLVSARVQPVDDTDFQVPADYTEVPQPAMPASVAPQAAAPSPTPAPNP
jgi:hypothetical protein